MQWIEEYWVYLLVPPGLYALCWALLRQRDYKRQRLIMFLGLMVIAMTTAIVKSKGATGVVIIGVVTVVLVFLLHPKLFTLGIASVFRSNHWFYQITGKDAADGAIDSLLDGVGPHNVPIDAPQVGRWRRKGQTEEAVAHLREVLDATPDHFESLSLLAAIHAEDLNDLKEAERLIQLIREAPTIGDGNKALAEQRVISWRERFAPGGSGRATGMRNQTAGNTVFLARSTIKTNPPPPLPSTPPGETKSPVVTVESVEEMCAAGRYGAAMESLEVLLAEHPNDLSIRAAKARLYMTKLGQPAYADKIISQLLEAREVQNEEADAVLKLARVCVRDRDRRRSAELLAQKLFQSPLLLPEWRLAALDLLNESQKRQVI